ncbi:protein TRANSPORT INHIBITOR RESPONSE 1 [Cucumis melo var. makuwa]|uniref:Protein TRANSPORT INHIBITOR RESPONSE 1 n=1 Tax=Cucumis melo var. makuwa TaxID=1194695 RepID=A0A5A7UGH2_CUCMM|nr:protein TRANSPORT INHIBITOR RESPONSE 1 [Cucumis melo var. makuwa]TYK12398.1 protein TRANSPORT INHIBITOR RESPONSE 1 [Cucumis melo var. makuwa]
MIEEIDEAEEIDEGGFVIDNMENFGAASLRSRRLGSYFNIIAATTTTIVPRAQPVPATTVVTLHFLQILLCLPPPSGVLFFNHVHVQPSPPPSSSASISQAPIWLPCGQICCRRFGWENSKADEFLLPVLKEYNKHEKLNLLRGGRVSELGEVTLKIWGFCFGVVSEKNVTLKLKSSLGSVTRTYGCFALFHLSFANILGFSTDGLTAIAANCSNLLKDVEVNIVNEKELEVSMVNVKTGKFFSLVPVVAKWLRKVSVSALERLVDKCPNLRTLRLNRPVPLDRHANLLRRAPQLVEFYVGCYMADLRSEVFSSLTGAFTSCIELKSLSGFWNVVPAFLPSVYPTCSRLTSLNLSYAIIQCDDLTKLNCQCHNLQKLWVLDFIEDSSLEVVADNSLCWSFISYGKEEISLALGAITKQMTAIEEMVASEYN